MSITSYIAGFAALGFSVRAYALGLQKRSLVEGLHTHFLTATAFGGIGYWLYHVQQRQYEQIEAKKHILLQNREAAE
ncbi:hypothetical protein BZG36_01373 [Bifiguratus adelaidae]|uniref:Uncharacterized protein n=1 Tax=Bifiguratus adelaidae TaxID=1938954 RepID=A0A261Y385_9FUNG|nr:hypothetical protein BZG36_01373 [Bifiguratus adelaidae]